MEPQELADELKVMYYDGASKNERAAHVILFGIKYAAELNAAIQDGCSIEKIIKLSGHGYIPEIKKGMTLAQYVELKQ